MIFADVVHIDLVAEIFGVSTDTLMQRLNRGSLPEAIHLDGGWSVPMHALAAIAEREGWPLDLDGRSVESRNAQPLTDRSLEFGPPLPEPERQATETMAAHAAVVLAKTQASAARAEAADLTRQLRRLRGELDAERRETERQQAEMSTAAKERAVLERDRAVADARADELRKQVEQERIERSMLAARIGVLEADREEAITSMDRLSRRRYERRQARSTGAPTPKWIQTLTENTQTPHPQR